MFLGSGWHKFQTMAQFKQVLAEYQLLPGALVAPIAVLLVPIETLLATAWLSGLWTDRFTLPAALMSGLLLAIYGTAVGINLARGRVYISCGCGIPGANDTDQPLSAGILVRNAVLCLLALLAALPALQRTLSWFDYVTMLAALLCGLLLYAATSQLLSNNASMAVWRQLENEEPVGG